MRLDEDVLGAEVGDDYGDVVGASVAEVVVGDDAFDGGDPAGAEVVGGAGQKRCAGGALLVGKDLGIRQAGVVVDG